MKKQILYSLILLIGLIAPQLEALSRDFKGRSNEYETYFCHDCVKFFRYFGKQDTWNEFDVYLHLIPTCDGKLCERCGNLLSLERDGIYAPYICWGSKDNFEFLQDHLLYCARNTSCQCYWPEKSAEAAIISDRAYKLFIELFDTTALSILVTDEKEQKSVLLSRPSNANKFSNRGLVIALTGKSFFYSHFYRTCQDIDQYSKLKFNDRDYSIIQNKIENILEEIGICYLRLYQSCYLKHQNQRIFQEYKFISQLFDIQDRWPIAASNICIDSYGYLAPSRKSTSFPINKAIVSQFERDLPSGWNDYGSYMDMALNQRQTNIVKNDKIDQTYWLNSKLLLGDGTFMNDMMLYQTAILFLTASIEANPTNKEAYIERAFAYFETNQLSLALQDYESAKKLIVVPPFRLGSHKAMMMTAIYVPENKTEFSKGLVSGTIGGAKVSTIEFVPSIFSCCRGVFNGLWAFVCSPTEVSQEMIKTAYAIGEFISTHSTEECFQCVVPELKELSVSWNNIDDYFRGQKIGYIIGKYGVDIFAPAGLLKGVNKVRALKRANIMCTLENCAASQTKQAKILEESLKRAVARESLITEATTKGNILIRNSNVQYHVMQEKHAWSKVIKLSGNVEEDFKKVALLLEENSILSEEYLLRSKKFAQDKIIRSDYQKTINDHTVQAVFEMYVETNQSFLQDAWVITK